MLDLSSVANKFGSFSFTLSCTGGTLKVSVAFTKGLLLLTEVFTLVCELFFVASDESDEFYFLSKTKLLQEMMFALMFLLV